MATNSNTQNKHSIIQTPCNLWNFILTYYRILRKCVVITMLSESLTYSLLTFKFVSLLLLFLYS